MSKIIDMLYLTYPTENRDTHEPDWPFALGGWPLRGENWVRHVYLDETGTDRKSKYALVAGAIVHVDSQWKEAAARLTALKHLRVPAEKQNKFVFHASEIMRGDPPFDNKQEWPIDRRVEVICEVLDIIRELKLPVAIAWADKEKFGIGHAEGRPGFSSGDLAHAAAFARCLSITNFYAQKFAADDVFSAIAEREDRMEWLLSITPLLLNVLSEKNDHIEPISNIINTVQFMGKLDAPLLQLADHAAFAWRHHLDGTKYGAKLRERLGGIELSDRPSPQPSDPINSRLLAHLPSAPLPSYVKIAP